MSAVVRVPVGVDLFTLVDAADAGLALEHKWKLLRRPSDAIGYATRSTRYRDNGRIVYGTVYLHRLLVGLGRCEGGIVDHRNGDTLDNRRENLRITDRRGNNVNVRRSARQSRGRLKGVWWSPRGVRKWHAEIRGGEVGPDGRRRRINLGCYLTEEEAARAYDDAARRYFGDFASPNFETEEEFARRMGWHGPLDPPGVAADFSFLQADCGGVAR